ncbi:histidine--tRNA ligase [Candidatus Saccharibacteria bacterium]|nr:histidine--tRNA ligase [Candidatus Saccharibacteria bacterium]
MKKINTSPISGMQEFLPEMQATFNKFKNKVSEVYHRHGYLNIETPTIDRCEILLAKAGGDTEKQIYKVFKTAETASEADQALRFDHTVPLARYVVQHENDLTFPFKVSQIGRNFRGERAQKGRFREFYQCDVDVVGRGELPLYYDADVIATLLDTFKGFELKTPVVARINNRKIMSGLLMALGLQEKAGQIFNIVDHAEKVPVEATRGALEELDLSKGTVAKLMAIMNLNGERAFVVRNLQGLGIENEVFLAGVDELDRVMKYLELDGYKEMIRADMKIVRGLDYYTGTVFEFNLPEKAEVGSVCGGGRYENLAGYFTEQKLPGVGGSIGLTRLFYVLTENDLVSAEVGKPVEYAVVPITDFELEFALDVAAELREKGASVTVVMSGRRLGDKLKYAADVAQKGIVIGESEVESGEYTVKEFN